MGVGISLSRLSSAVADEGGIGVIATAGIGMTEIDSSSGFLAASKRALRQEIRKAREATKGILGVNIMAAMSNFEDVVQTAIDEQIDIIFSGAGLPLNLPQFHTEKTATKLVPIVSSGRAARIICRRWIDRFNYAPDAVVVEGPRAGGHLGFAIEQISDPAFALEKILPDVIVAVKPFAEQSGKTIPVISGGGIYTGGDIFTFLNMGAAGVQMGTRFVTTHECDASATFKQAYLDAKQEDIVIIRSPVGMPGRAIRNDFIDAMNRGDKEPYQCPYHCIITCDYKNVPYCVAHALISAQKGDLEHGFPFAGANAHRITEIVSVKELIATLVEEYNQAANDRAVEKH